MATNTCCEEFMMSELYVNMVANPTVAFWIFTVLTLSWFLVNIHNANNLLPLPPSRPPRFMQLYVGEFIS